MRALGHKAAVAAQKELREAALVQQKHRLATLSEFLAQHPGALHVRLNAPAHIRVGRAVELDGITAEVAEERREQEDLIRAELSQRLYGWNPNDDENYDVVVNTGRYSLDEAADMIIRAYETRFGANR